MSVDTERKKASRRSGGQERRSMEKNIHGLGGKTKRNCLSSSALLRRQALRCRTASRTQPEPQTNHVHKYIDTLTYIGIHHGDAVYTDLHAWFTWIVLFV